MVTFENTVSDKMLIERWVELQNELYAFRDTIHVGDKSHIKEMSLTNEIKSIEDLLEGSVYRNWKE